MRVAVVTGPGSVELQEMPAPRCGPRQVVVAVSGCGLCTLDRRLFSGQQPIYPVAAGHEPAGRVVEVGSDVAGLSGTPAVGDLVALDMRTRCGTCAVCRRGRSALCLAPQGRKLESGVISMAGGLSELIALDAAQAWPVGEAPADHAAMGEPVACVAHSIRRSGFGAGDRVAVIGAGYMGRLHLAMLTLGGASSVGVVEPSPQRRDEAVAAGASWVADPEEAERADGGCDVVFVTAGAPGSLELALALSAKGGSVVLYGSFPRELSVGVSPNDIHHHETAIVGVHSHEPEDWRIAAGLLVSGSLGSQLDALVTARFPLADAAGAFELAASSPVYRVIVGAS